MGLSKEEKDELARLQLEKLRREDAAVRRQEEVILKRKALREAQYLKRELRRQRRSELVEGFMIWLFYSESDLAKGLRVMLFFMSILGVCYLLVLLDRTGWFD